MLHRMQTGLAELYPPQGLGQVACSCATISTLLAMKDLSHLQRTNMLEEQYQLADVHA